MLEIVTRLEIVRDISCSRLEITRPDNNYDSINSSKNIIKITIKEIRDDDLIPLRTGLRIWSASFIFMEQVLIEEIENKTVLELGSGTGVNGLLCAKLNARGVTLTDIDEKAIALCLQNSLINELYDIKAKRVDWEDANTYLVNNNDNNKFDTIVAVDVVYLEEHAKALAECVACHLEKERGTFISCCGVRKREYFEQFLKELALRGLEVYYDEDKLEIKSGLMSVKEIQENHKHDLELKERGKGYRLIRARFKKEQEVDDEMVMANKLGEFLADLDLDLENDDQTRNNINNVIVKKEAYDNNVHSDEDENENVTPYRCQTVKKAQESLKTNGFCIFQDDDFKNMHANIELFASVHLHGEKYLDDLLSRCKQYHGVEYETDIFRFKEICSRAHKGKRFDLQASCSDSNDDITTNIPESGKMFQRLMQRLAASVKAKCENIFKADFFMTEQSLTATIVNQGCVTSFPRAPEQHFHADGRKEGMFNAFVALHDVNQNQGPTEFICGSHRFDHDAPYVDTKTRKKQERAKKVSPELLRGDILIYDYRTLHRGGANKRCHDRRSLAYFLFNVQGAAEDTWNFDNKSIWDD